MALTKLEIKKIYKPKSVLIIDDYPDMRGSIRRMVEAFGVHKVDTASNGEEAIGKCETVAYDIILADYNLGDNKNGQQILEELRFKDLLKNTSLYVMITAETTKSMVFGALEYQPDDYLTKPFTQSVLEKRLDRLVVEKEVLYEINNSIDKKNYDKAIVLCQQRIKMNDKYRQRCLRIISSCLYKKGMYVQAKQVYKTILEERDIEWANIGLGKTMIALNEADEAEVLFDKLIADGCLCLEVYDCMAEIKNRNGDSESAQKILEKAIEVSPNAILRQETLAIICEDNQDWEQAEKSRKKVIRLGNNSVYESPEHHFKLARTIVSIMEHSDNPKGRLKDASSALQKAKQKYKDDAIVLQSDIIEANVFAKAGETEKSQALVEDVQTRLETAISKPPQMLLDMAQTFDAVGEHDKAKSLLKELAVTYEHNDEISDAIDRLSDEPLSKRGKQKAIDLNSAGKELFTKKEFKKAIQLFSQALKHYPQNMGLNLNLMLALVREMSASGPNKKHLELCATSKERLSQLTADSPLFDRYRVLCTHFEKLSQATE